MADELWDKDPTQILRNAVNGMLPKNKCVGVQSSVCEMRVCVCVCVWDKAVEGMLQRIMPASAIQIVWDVGCACVWNK